MVRYTKRGGLHFVRIGNVNITFSKSKKEKGHMAETIVIDSILAAILAILAITVSAM